MTMTTTAPYRQQRLQRRAFMKAMKFGASPKPGESFPDFELPTVDGTRVRREDFVGRTPVLITLASATCPMTASSTPVLNRLHDEFGDRVAFLTLYVREANPGDQIRQAEDLDEKNENARLFQRRDRVSWPIAVDGLEGELHEQLGRHPNAAYLVDEEGRVAFRSLWSNAEGPLRRGIEAILRGEETPIGEERPRVGPMLSGIGVMSETLEAAGPVAKRNAFRQAPPIYLLGKIASVFRPLPPLGRGVAAVGVTALGLAALARLLSSKRNSRR